MLLCYVNPGKDSEVVRWREGESGELTRLAHPLACFGVGRNDALRYFGIGDSSAQLSAAAAVVAGAF